MGTTKATEKTATDAKATNAKTGAKASGTKASGAAAQDSTAKAAASKVVDAAADAIKTAAVATDDANPVDGPARPAIGDGSLDRTPTATQIVEESAFPNATEKLQEPKIVRHDTPPGAGPGADPTTIKEEVRLLDPKTLSSDDGERLHTMQVLARTQGINQSVKLGNGKIYTVFQDGSAKEEEVPVIPAAAEEKEKPE